MELGRNLVRATSSSTDDTLHLDFAAISELQLSEEWAIGAGWNFRFVMIPAATKVPISHLIATQLAIERLYVKVIVGFLVHPPRRPVPPKPFATSTTIVDTPETISTGTEDTLVAIFAKTRDCPQHVTDMHQVVFSGPSAEILRWVPCSERPWGASFKNVEFYNARGFTLTMEKQLVCTIQFWTAGVGVNCGDHDHSDLKGASAFCETHLGLMNGTGSGGMVLVITENGTRREEYVSVREGEEHGPFWEFDSITGEPKRRADGSVVYVLHRWQAGSGIIGQAYDLWVAFELPPDLAKVC